jgi:hypothetical protein
LPPHRRVRFVSRTQMRQSGKVTRMKTLALLLLSLMFIAVFKENVAAQSSYDLRSPDGRIEIRIRSAATTSC